MRTLDEIYELARKVEGTVFQSRDYGVNPKSILVSLDNLEKMLAKTEKEKREAYLAGVQSGLQAAILRTPKK